MTTHFNDMDALPVFPHLRRMANTPFDLTAKALDKNRFATYKCKMAGFDLLYATQRIDNQTMDALQEMADQSDCIQQFLAMKKGAIINKIEGYASENRAVLHTACRDVFTQDPCQPEASRQAKTELDKLRQFLADLDAGLIKSPDGGPFTDLINIGIGGSDLGPRALYLALAAFKKKDHKVHFISNIDPDDAASILRQCDLTRTLVNVVSKSGTTLETLTNEELVRAAFTQKGLDPANHFIAVTGENSPMDNPQRYLRSFYMFDYIGGRYSATSMVGAVMLGFALGYEAVLEILLGANSVDLAAEETDIKKNIPLLMALLGIWNHNFLGHETLAILPYSQALIRFTAHLQQCDMESNGKSINRQGHSLNYQTGPIIWGEPGTNGQHAFYQLIHQGTTIVPTEFIGFRRSQYEEDIEIKGTISQEKLNANLLAQSLALATGEKNQNPNKNFPGNRPNSLLIADRLTPFNMGSLLAIYEAKITFQGFIWNINSFDQEGVQLGKNLANRLLDHYAAHRQDKKYDGEKNDNPDWTLLKHAGMI
ncbi:MAG: glucose-6-phosphate isomerase [Proteobacteria bacterium]|nr:glucose-6-phosphate isomerase [Pseudomonadota bacterium]MBU1715323.1 glucose-6-phosphate isomerase [Pseudomonadota bacterium]